MSGCEWLGRAMKSGFDFAMEIWRLDTVRDAKIARIVFFRTREEAPRALEAATG